MFAIIAAVLIIFSSTSIVNSDRYETELLIELKKQMEQIDRNINLRLDRMEKRFESKETNMSLIMETIVEQQMVITAEIFTVSQTLPFCCCQYHQNSTNPPKPENLPTNCDEAMGESGENGIYKINVPNSGMDPFNVYCMKKIVKNVDDNPINGTWMIVQRRQYNNIGFYRGWTDYKIGFGTLDKDFWIGLDKLHALTNSVPQELWIQLESDDVWAVYSGFAISDESEGYALHTLGAFTGPAGDSLSYHMGGKWGTYDREHEFSCAAEKKGAWWFNSCSAGNLNGMFGNGEGGGIMWWTYKNGVSNQYAHMAIRSIH